MNIDQALFSIQASEIKPAKIEKHIKHIMQYKQPRREAAKLAPRKLGKLKPKPVPAKKTAAKKTATKKKAKKKTGPTPKKIVDHLNESHRYDSDQSIKAGGVGSGRYPKGSGHLFVSPNELEGTRLTHAMLMLHSQFQKNFENKAKRLASEIVGRSTVHSALGIWADGAENSTEIVIGKADKDKQEYLAALLGKSANQKAVLNWVPNVNGTHSMYAIKAAGDIKKFDATLEKAGIEFRTIEPQGKNKAVAYVLDQDGSLRDKINTVTGANGYATTEEKGEGNFIGSWTSREEGHKAYDSIIAAYEIKHPEKLYSIAASIALHILTRSDNSGRNTDSQTKRNILAGGPGSGRHTELGLIKKKPKAVFVQKHLSEDKLAPQRQKTIEQYRKNQSEGKSAKGRPILSDKQKLAQASVVTATKEHQDKAEEIEKHVTKAIGGEQSSNNKAFDVHKQSGKTHHAIEVKSLLMQHNDKITMSKSALARKKQYGADNPTHKLHTVAVDLRGKKPVYYHHTGVGSFRLGSMTKVDGGAKGLAKIFS